MSKILIIEDEAAIRRVLKKIISEENDTYQVEEAEDGLVGIEMISKSDFDLVLCDIKMPKMDGVEVLEKYANKVESLIEESGLDLKFEMGPKFNMRISKR